MCTSSTAKRRRRQMRKDPRFKPKGQPTAKQKAAWENKSRKAAGPK